jgi:hypothetical protein
MVLTPAGDHVSALTRFGDTAALPHLDVPATLSGR